MKALCPSSPVAATPPRKPTVPSVFINGGTKSKTTSAASKIGAALPPATTNSPETSLPPQSWSVHFIGSSCESRPYSSFHVLDNKQRKPSTFIAHVYRPLSRVY